MRSIINRFNSIIICLFIIKAAIAQSPYNTLSDGFTAPSAASLSFAKYVDIPVDPTSGTTAIDIPIYTVSDGPLSHNISLSYHTGGIRVDELASTVGLGWNLNAGGIISRTVRGIADDTKDKGWIHTDPLVAPQHVPQAEGIALGNLDGEPDIFFYNFDGMGGKFVFNKDDQGNYMIVNIPQSDVKITPTFDGNEKIVAFELVSGDGTMYTFDKFQKTDVDNLDEYNEVWYLTKKESFDYKHRIIFSYVRDRYNYESNKSCLVSKYWNGGQQTGTNNCAGGTFTIKIDGWIISSITTSTETVTFHNQARVDLIRHSVTAPLEELPKQIDKITIENGDFCFDYELTQTYFSASETEVLSRRLKLDQVQKISCETGHSDQEAPYRFNYHTDVVPSILSRARDHWGYYNGVTSNDSKDHNIPLTSVEDEFGNTLTYGSGNHNSANAVQQNGALTKVTFPTGGYTQLIYEPNEYRDLSTQMITEIDLPTCLSNNEQCCVGDSMDQTILLTQDMLDNGELTLIAETTETMTCGDINHGAIIIIRENNNQGDTVYTNSVNTVAINDEGYVELNILLSTIIPLEPGNNYNFEVHGVNGKGHIIMRYTSSATPKTCGGIRIKEIISHDGILAADNIRRTFDYELESNAQMPSALLYNEPSYGALAFGDDRTAIFTSDGVNSLRNIDGRHLIYTRVRENFNGNGYKIYRMERQSQPQSSDFYPSSPILYNKLDGQLKELFVYRNNDGLDQRTEFRPYQQDSYSTIQYALRQTKVEGFNGSSTIDIYPFNQYFERTGIYRNFYIFDRTDEVVTWSTYRYLDESKNVFLPSSTSVTNSNGDIYESLISYTVDYVDGNSVGVKDNLSNRNMISIPFKTEKLVNDVKVDGSRSEIELFASNGIVRPIGLATDFPRIYKLHRDEYNFSGNPVEVLQSTIESYDANGLVKSTRIFGWDHSTTYTYNTDKLLSSKTYDGHENSYIYHNGSSLVATKTNVDETTMSYTFDGLMRLESTTDDQLNIVNSHTYFYPPNENPDLLTNKPFVETKVDYPVVADANNHSKVDDIVTREYIDGLGRSIQTVRRNQSYNGFLGSSGAEDLVLAREYDRWGRVEYQYAQRISSNSDGSYVTPQNDWERTHVEYHASPLNRISQVTPPDWYATTSSYGFNTVTDNVKKDGGDDEYGMLELNKLTTRDPEGRTTIKFTDKIGRTILTRRTDSNDNPSNRFDTYTVYDDKDRVTHVLPPGALDTNSIYEKIFYKYTYSQEDNLLTKLVPGADEVEYVYDDRNLLLGYQDGILGSKWYTYDYDGFGREVEQGLSNSEPTQGSSSPDDLLIETIYGTQNFNKDKIEESKTKILNSARDELTSKFIYDGTTRLLLRTESNTHLNLNDIDAFSTDLFYDGATNVYKTKFQHDDPTLIDHEAYSFSTFDHAERRIKEHYQETGFSLPTELLCDIIYDQEELVQTKFMGDQLIKTNYGYHPNNLIASMASTSNPFSGWTTSDRLFNLYFEYDGPDAQSPLTNGDISAIKWDTHASGGFVENFSYDHIGRLKTSDYQYQAVNSFAGGSGNPQYTSSYTYDSRGNLSNLTREGAYGNVNSLQYGEIDNLSFSYNNLDNRLTNVTEQSSSPGASEGFSDGASGSYTYTDGNGNITIHRDKNIEIEYNHLNLPETVTFTGTNKEILFTYDANGTLLYRVAKVGATQQNRRDYVGQYEYVTPQGQIRQVDIAHTQEGYLRFETGQTPTFFYSINDHLGNTRMVVSDQNNDSKITSDEVSQEAHYYPFGMELKGPWMATNEKITNYKYNSIEQVDDFGLNLNFASFRTLDVSIGRWMQVDPKAESLASLSPYNSMNNNPISFTDPKGDAPWLAIGIAAALGGSSGYQVGRAQGASGLGMFGYIAGGALIGGISAGVGSGVSASVGKATSTRFGGLIAGGAGGAAGGVIAGAGFSALAGHNALEGAWKGGVSGLAGGAVGAHVGGDSGAFFGGSVSSSLNTALYGGNAGDVFRSGIVGGTIAGANYELSTSINYGKSSLKSWMSYKQFKALTAATQRSFARGKEFGAWLLNDGGIEMWPSGTKNSITPTPMPKNVFRSFHTHPNQGANWNPDFSPADISFNMRNKVSEILISRQSIYSHLHFGTSTSHLGSNRLFNPYIYNPWLWKK